MKLSIIVPTLNEEKYLPILVSQLKKQTFQDFEIIVSDGGSTDKTREIAERLGCKIVDGGLPAKARNEGVKIAQGELLLFLDADNIYLPNDFIEKAIQEFEKNNLGVAGFPLYVAGNFIDKIIYFLYNLWVKITQKFSPLACNVILTKKEVFDKVSGFDEGVFVGEDHDFAQRAGKVSKFGFIEGAGKVITSARRLEKEGRLRAYLKYFLAGIHFYLFGPPKKKIFNYDFNLGPSKNFEKELKLQNMEKEKLPAPEFHLEYPKLKAGSLREKFSKLIFISIGFFIGLIFTGATYYFLESKNYFLSFSFEGLEQKLKDWQEKIFPPKVSPPQIATTTESKTPSFDFRSEPFVPIVKLADPAVVSVIVTKDVPKLELYYENPFKGFEDFFGAPFEFEIPQYRVKGYEKKEIGGGTAFFVDPSGFLLTNAHVVSDEKADYTVFTNDGKKYPAKVLARDPVKDLAILKVEGENFPYLKLGDSDKVEIGQIVVAIGNALGEFRNTVSVGVISGLGRKVTAQGGGVIETMENVIQTDAALNPGNSGGPLLNMKGEVIGVNFAIAQGAQNIGFSIPINWAKKMIEQVKATGKLSFPFLGVRYTLVNESIQKAYNLPVDYGAFIYSGSEGEPAIVPGSPAEKAGLKEGDVILEVNGEKITQENSLVKIISKYQPQEKIRLLILRNGKKIEKEVILGEKQF